MDIAEKTKGISNGFYRFIGFLREVRIQMRKIDWPSRRETLRFTLIVIISALLLAFFLGGVDILFTAFLNKVLL